MSKTITQSIWQEGQNTCICVRVCPNSSKNTVHFQTDSSIEVALKAKAEAGKANSKLLEFLSTLLSLSESSFIIRSGHTSRKKVIVIKSTDATLVKRRLSLADNS